MTNALTTLSTLQQQITAFAERLRPCGDEAVAKALRTLQTAGLSLSANIPPSEVNTVYSYALSGLSGEALTTVCRKLIRGEYQVNHGFVPLPSELATMVRVEQQALSEELYRLKTTREALEFAQSRNAAPQKGTCRDPDSVARVKAMREAFLRNHAAEKAKAVNPVPHMPTSPERREMLAKIMDMPDAPNISAEQMAYRRKCEAELANADTKQEETDR